MNIFVLDKNPYLAALYYDDVRIAKMVVEVYQQLGSALRRHGATDEQMPLTKKGTPLKGGYHHHPCTRWVGDSCSNFIWACLHGSALADEFQKRFGKEHFCADGIETLWGLRDLIPKGGLTPFAQAMPDEYKDDDAVVAYRRYYQSKAHSKGGVRYDRRVDGYPDWWNHGDYVYGVKYEVIE